MPRSDKAIKKLKTPIKTGLFVEGRRKRSRAATFVAATFRGCPRRIAGAIFRYESTRKQAFTELIGLNAPGAAAFSI
jgi:hypothetical protein